MYFFIISGVFSLNFCCCHLWDRLEPHAMSGVLKLSKIFCKGCYSKDLMFMGYAVWNLATQV